MDFTIYPYNMIYKNEPPTFYAPYASALINHTNGKYLFYTNGGYAYDSTRQKLINGDTLIPNHIGNGGWAAYQGTMILPYPNHPNQYYIPSETISNRLDLEGPDRIAAAIAYFNRPDGRGQLINRSIIVHDTGYIGNGLAACRHANGRDWWLLNNHFKYSNRFYRYLLDPNGMKLMGTQNTGTAESMVPVGNYHASFSANGSKYAIMDVHLLIDTAYHWHKHLKVFDFDRCTGLLSNAIQIDLPLDASWNAGLAFSPNSRFIYLSNRLWVYQYDTQTQQLQTIATFDGFQDPDTQGYAGFGSTYLAADGKVYIATPLYQNTHYLHVIHYPDSLGAACGFEARGVYIPHTTNSNLPNMPYFGLGAADGTVCDTLGYDQPKYAQLRIEPYHVLFQNVPTLGTQTQTVIAHNIGDTTVLIQNPVIQQGIYTITLPTSIPAYSTATVTVTCSPTTAVGSFKDTATVVSNAVIVRNSVFLDASVVVGTSPLNPPKGDFLRVFPNPAANILNVEIPQNSVSLHYKIYDILGREMQNDILQNQISLKNLNNGLYYLSILDKNGGVVYPTAKFVVQHE